MDIRFATMRLAKLINQRNTMVSLLSLSLATNVLQGVERFRVKDKVIILPPQIRQEVWVRGDEVSESWLEEWSVFFCGLLLNIAPSTIDYQIDLVLRHADPEAYQVLKSEFLKDKLALIKNNTSTTFQPQQVIVDKDKLRCRVTGVLATIIGKDRLSERVQDYDIQYRMLPGGKILLHRFKRIEESGTDAPADVSGIHNSQENPIG
jgi:conjugal transfer pilus assembly protein TraE